MRFLCCFFRKTPSISEEEYQRRIQELSRKKEELLGESKGLEASRKALPDKIRRIQLEKEHFFRKTMAEMKQIDREVEYVMESYEDRKYDAVFLKHYEKDKLPRIYSQQIRKLSRYTMAFELSTKRYGLIGRMIVKDDGLSVNQHLEHLEAALKLRDFAWEAIQLFREVKVTTELDVILGFMEEEFQMRINELNGFKC